jgi:hypothetical protein
VDKLIQDVHIRHRRVDGGQAEAREQLVRALRQRRLLPGLLRRQQVARRRRRRQSSACVGVQGCRAGEGARRLVRRLGGSRRTCSSAGGKAWCTSAHATHAKNQLGTSIGCFSPADAKQSQVSHTALTRRRPQQSAGRTCSPRLRARPLDAVPAPPCRGGGGSTQGSRLGDWASLPRHIQHGSRTVRGAHRCALPAARPAGSPCLAPSPSQHAPARPSNALGQPPTGR